MKILASNREHRERYEVYLDGVNVSDCVTEADDILHQVEIVVRRPTGDKVRRGHKVLTATAMGHVAIVAKVHRFSIEGPTQ
jgi:elongation factor P--beta-lysine ligase